MTDIEAKRKTMRLTRKALCQAAGVSERHYGSWLSGARQPRASTIARLNAALHRFKVGVGAEAGELAPASAYKVTLVLVAFAMNADARAALDAQPGKRATFDPVWKQAAHCRQIAYSICNGSLGFRTSDVARAAGVTKSAVSMAIRDLSMARDNDPALDSVMNRLEDLLG